MTSSDDTGTGSPTGFDKLTAKDFVGAWQYDDFEHIVAADLNWVSRKRTGHIGWYGKLAYFPDLDGRPYILTDSGGGYPQYAYGTGYKGGGTQGATKIEHPKKLALPLVEFQKDRFVLEINGTNIVYARTADVAEPLLAVRLEELKAMLAAEEASSAGNMAAWNNQFGIAQDLQVDRWKQINSWKLS